MAEKSLKKSEDKYNELSSSLKALHTKLQHDHRELEWENPSGTKVTKTKLFIFGAVRSNT